MAKAYGYAARKKEAYKSSRLLLSNWDVRGLSLEPTMESMEGGSIGQVTDTQPCTGDLESDTEKVRKTIFPMISF